MIRFLDALFGTLIGISATLALVFILRAIDARRPLRRAKSMPDDPNGQSTVDMAEGHGLKALQDKDSSET
jgi:hypothetical protein